MCQLQEENREERKQKHEQEYKEWEWLKKQRVHLGEMRNQGAEQEVLREGMRMMIEWKEKAQETYG